MATGELKQVQIMDTSALPSGGNIDGNGVVVRILLEGLAANIGGSYDLSKFVGLGFSPGYDRAKTYSTGNIARILALTEKIIRPPFPNQALRMERAVGADLEIYAYATEEWYVGDHFTGGNVSIEAGFYTGAVASTLTAGANLTNSSTRPYRMPQISWVALEPWRRMTGAGLTVEAIIDHHNARDGQPVAAVDFYVTRPSVAPSVASASAMVLSNEVTTPYRPGVFRATVPIGSLTNGEGDLGATIYPWVGMATWDTNSADFETFPCLGTPKLLPVCVDLDNSYLPCGAYISPDGTTKGTPTIADIVPLTSLGPYVPGTTNAFATIQALMNVTRSFNMSAARTRTHDDMAGVSAVIPSGRKVPDWGTVHLESTTTYPPGLGYFGITREAGSSISDTGLTSNIRRKPTRVRLDGLGIFPGAANTVAYQITLNSLTVGAPSTPPTKAAAAYFVVRNCVGSHAATDSSFSAFLFSGYTYFIGCSFTNIAGALTGAGTGAAVLHGCTYNYDTWTGNQQTSITPSIVGCDLKNIVMTGVAAAGGQILGRMIHSVRTESDGLQSTLSVAQDSSLYHAIGVRGESWVNLLVRKCKTGAAAGVMPEVHAPTAQLSADFRATDLDQPAITNMNFAYISAPGGRWSGPYNEINTSRVLKEVREIGLAMSIMNAKGDLMSNNPGTGNFAPSGNRTGIYAYRYGNARFGVVLGAGSSQAGVIDVSPTSWLGDAKPPVSAFNVGFANMFERDTSVVGTNNYADRGDYSPKPILWNRIPAGRAATGFDLFGNPRDNLGGGAAGAVERSAVVALLRRRRPALLGRIGL